MDGKQDKRQEPGRGRAEQGHKRPGDPAHPQPGRQSREQDHQQKETSRRRDDDLLREEDLHDEAL